jgi:hypothetical protein
MTNWSDVADTAIKIGLGALLGGVFSIVLTWLSHRQSTSRDYFKRRRELIEGIVDDLDRFYRNMSLFRSSLQNLLFINSCYAEQKLLINLTHEQVNVGHLH